jgi:hypothetical protein
MKNRFSSSAGFAELASGSAALQASRALGDELFGL